MADVKVINHVLCIKENGNYRPFSAEELTNLLLASCQMLGYVCVQSQSPSKPIEVYRCARCGSTSCSPDEIASSPAYGT